MQTISILTLIGAIAAGTAEVIHFNHTSAVFELLSPMKTVASEWRLVTHVDTKDFFVKQKALREIVDEFSNLCSAKPIKTQSLCVNGGKILKNKLEDVRQLNLHLRAAMTPETHRTKRTAVKLRREDL
jgi:hypothetical protein